MAKKHFGVKLVQRLSAANLWKPLGPPNLQNGCRGAPCKASQKEFAKRCGKGCTFDLLDLPKLHEGSQKSRSRGFRKKVPKDLQKHPLKETFGFPNHPRRAKTEPVCPWYRFQGLATLPGEGGVVVYVAAVEAQWGGQQEGQRRYRISHA